MNAPRLTFTMPIPAHELLGISHNSTPAEIRAAFRSKAAVVHPDRGGSDEAMRELIEARDTLLNLRTQRPRRLWLETAQAQEMEAFSRRIKVELVFCWLALPKIQRFQLDLDHPRAAKLARGEANRSARNEWSQGISLDDAELIAGSSGSSDAGVLDMREQCRAALSDTTFAPGQIEENGYEAQIIALLKLKHAVKPRDREILEMRFEKSLSISEIAEKKGQSPQAVYAAFKRMREVLPDAKKRQEWVDEHCAIETLAGVESAPVVLDKTGQMGWDLAVQA